MKQIISGLLICFIAAVGLVWDGDASLVEATRHVLKLAGEVMLWISFVWGVLIVASGINTMRRKK